MRAFTLVARALKLINVPGAGKTLSGQEESDGFDTLKELVDSEAVSQYFIPGIHRHFFALTGSESVFSYGPGADFDTTPFSHPAPIKIEDAYIRAGAIVTGGTPPTLSGNRTDYPVEIIGQREYNDICLKGNGGRPYRLLYSRAAGIGEIRLDNAAASGDVLILDVLVNAVELNSRNDELQVNAEAIRFLRYKLAMELAPEYGKSLSATQMESLRDAENNMHAANSRPRTRSVDTGLLNRPRYNFNGGRY